MSPSLPVRVFNRISKEIRKVLFHDQWVIMAATGAGMDALAWNKFNAIIPPPDRYWADPFVITRDNFHYVFIEEKMYETKRGRISCLTLDQNAKLISNQVVLEKPYHLSFPFLFEYRGDLYMMPETAQNKTIELYRCARFPDQWEYVKNIMSGMYLVDAALLEHAGKWWMFVNIMGESGSSWDTLNLYYADSPLSESWAPHPRNPIVTDIRSARPAGRLFYRDGRLIRPSQDCSWRYGYALKFNHVLKLNETEYEETLLQSFYPDSKYKVIATHTFNQANDIVVIDALMRNSR